MAIISGVLPPSRANWELVCTAFSLFPLVALLQWVPFINSFYQAGKTSGTLKFNIPGKIGWVTMETPGFVTLLYIMITLPAELGLESLPRENWALAGLFTFHYIYRAIISPLIAPTMSPISPLVWMFALLFQLSNAISIGGWLAGYGDKLTSADWADQKQGFVTSRRMELGFVLFGLGLAVNIFHDDQLREIRRVAARNQKKMELEADKTTGKHKAPKKNGVDKLYMIPNTGFFRWIFYPHYVAEWVEWSGFWLIGGLSFTPGRTFVLNEIATMLPRAVEGKHWYISRFGKEKVAGRTAIIPGLL